MYLYPCWAFTGCRSLVYLFAYISIHYLTFNMLLFKGLPEKENMMEKQTKAENGQRSWNWQPIVANNPKLQIPLKLVYIFPNYVTSPLNHTVLQSTLLAVIQILCPYYNHQTSHWQRGEVQVEDCCSVWSSLCTYAPKLVHPVFEIRLIPLQ